MPCNLYGPGDNFDLNNSHVLPALIRKVVEAKLGGKRELIVWGSGSPKREFLYSEDLADACIHLLNLSDAAYADLLNRDSAPLINIGMGTDITIRELAELISAVLGFEGELVFDKSRPDGTFRKVLDVSRIQALGWNAKTGLAEGIQKTYLSASAQLEGKHPLLAL
jgi:GDP-L-fucose synthase